MTQIFIIQKVINSVLTAYNESKAHLDKATKTMTMGMDFIYGDISYYSAIKKRRVDKIEKLIHDFPEGLCEKDERDLLPIHLACSMANGYSTESVEIIRLLVEADPTTLREHSASGHLPLHCAVESNAPVDTIKLLIETFPESLRDGIPKTFQGKPCQFLPIHLSLELPSHYGGPNKEVVTELMRADPEALRVFHNVHDECVTSLYRTFKQDRTFKQPYSTSLCPSRIILALDEYINAKTNLEKSTDQKMIVYNPFHTFLSFQFFRHQNEKDASIINDFSSYNHYQQEFVQVLQEILYYHYRNHYYMKEKDGTNNYYIRPNSMLVQPDEKGDLPLHMAVASGHRVEVLEFLTQMHPDAVCQPNGNGDLPWEVAIATNAHTSVTEFLVKAYLEVCLPHGGGGDYPTMIAAAAAAASSSLDGLSLLYQLLLTHPVLVKYHCGSPTCGATKDVERTPKNDNL